MFLSPPELSPLHDRSNAVPELMLGAAKAGLPQPVCAALLSPWADLSHSGDSHLTLRTLDPTLSVLHFLAPAARAYAGKHSTYSPQISPLLQVQCVCVCVCV